MPDEPSSNRLEIGLNVFLGRDVARVNERTLAQAMRELVKLWDGASRQDAQMLILAIADALDDDRSLWKLKLSRSGVKGPHRTIAEIQTQLAEDVYIHYIVSSQVEAGVKKEAAKQIAMTKYNRSASAIDDAMARIDSWFDRLSKNP